jgi:DNA-directed RNA polymerase specialized sigma24 family protein
VNPYQAVLDEAKRQRQATTASRAHESRFSPLFAGDVTPGGRSMARVLGEMELSSMHSSLWEAWRTRWNAAHPDARGEVLRAATAALEAWCPRYKGWSERAFPADEQQRHTDYQPAGEPPQTPPRPYRKLSDGDLCVFVRAGDGRALEELLARHWRYVRVVGKGLSTPGDDAASEWIGQRRLERRGVRWWAVGWEGATLKRLGVWADPMSQRTLVAFWESATEFQVDRSSFRTWACRRTKSRLLDAIRDANAQKHQPLNAARSLEAPLLSESESEGEPTSLGDIAVIERGSDGVLRMIPPDALLMREPPNEPLESVIAEETYREILEAATAREREALHARERGEPLDDAARQALHRLYNKLLVHHRHVFAP